MDNALAGSSVFAHSIFSANKPLLFFFTYVFLLPLVLGSHVSPPPPRRPLLVPLSLNVDVLYKPPSTAVLDWGGLFSSPPRFGCEILERIDGIQSVSVFGT